MNNIINEFEKLELEDKICGICACIKENEIVLDCKHSYCYECIYDWLIIKKKKNTFVDKKSSLLECPYCKKQINRLPLLENFNYVRGITNTMQITPIQLIHKNNLIIEPTIINKVKPLDNLLICNAPIKSKNNSLCKNKGKKCFGYYCGKHKKYHELKPKVNCD